MTDVQVHLDRQGTMVLVGTAHFTRSPAGVSTTFTYEQSYLNNPQSLPIDPAFPLYSGNQYVQSMPGTFSDSAPDRWGRNLLTRRERQIARDEERTARNLDDVDFLLGVNDLTRQGALRFTTPGSSTFLSPRTDVPRLMELPELLRASDEVSADGDGADAYKVLLAAGTASLGGARPKASVRLDDGALGIAKFPHGSDGWDVMAWEAVALDIAAHAGIRASAHRLVKVGERHVLLVTRFDRRGEQRVGYMSAMTMLEQRDGASGDYVDIAERLPDFSASLGEDRRELFVRAALNVALHNTDDHLRNHGLTTVQRGWRLSPAFDINPNPDRAEHRATAIAGATGVDDEWDGLMELAEACGIAPDEARHRLGEVAAAAGSWREFATRRGITESDQKRMGEVLDERANYLKVHAEHIISPPGRTPVRGKTTNGSNRGSFASTNRRESRRR